MWRAISLFLLWFPYVGFAQDTATLRFLCFEKLLFSMDTLREGEISEARFPFKVCDTAPVVIHQVWPGCGCTVADYPKDTLYPGKDYTISLQYFSQGRPGYFLRTAHVLYHSVNPGQSAPYAEAPLSISGFVVPQIQTTVTPVEPKGRQRKRSR